MTTQLRPVTVHMIPAQVSAARERHFLQELQYYVETERPRLVLDCSHVTRMDDAIIHLLLSCLEEGMKRNGDVKLASLSMSSEEALRSTGIDRLFEIHDTAASAVRSFQRGYGMDPAFSLAASGEDRKSDTAA